MTTSQRPTIKNRYIREFCTKILYHQNDIQVKVIPNDSKELVGEFLRLHFYPEEPLIVGIEPKGIPCKEEEEITASFLKHNSSLMATKEKTGEIAGLVLGAPKGPDEANRLFESARSAGSCKFGRILELIACIERDTNIFGRYNVKQVLHVHTLSVNKEFRGQNIGRILLNELGKYAKRQGYDMLTVDCTSYYSARICERLGWECVNVVYYKDYTDVDGCLICQPPGPHEGVKTYALALTENVTRK